jgi:hypothetical protein
MSATETLTPKSPSLTVLFARGYTFVAIESLGNTGQCSSVIPANQVITYAARDASSSWHTFTTSYTTASPAWGIQINGYNIAQVTATTSTSSYTSSSTSSGTGSTSPSPTPPPSSGLSTGAKAGIGIGVALLAIALGALIVFILARRKSRRNGHAVAIPTSELAGAYEPKSGYTDQVQVYELDNRTDVGMGELDGREAPVEMQSRTPVDVKPPSH